MNRIIEGVRNVFTKMPIGFAITFRHMFKKSVTLDYPRKKEEMAPRYKGLHYLDRYEDGSERCVCCGLCAAACPADAIYMEPTENENGERLAKVYEINMLRCIFCGFCEEACPEEAIFLGREYEFADQDRSAFIYDKEKLLVPHPHKENLLKRSIRRLRRAYGIKDSRR